MEVATIRLRIRAKLSEGLLPRANFPRVSGEAGSGEPCDACGEPIPAATVEIEGPLFKGAVVKFHVRCFTLWQTEREAGKNSPGRG
jgi:hypothetical protein